jgi:nitrate reductase NapAB chaperone NapD
MVIASGFVEADGPEDVAQVAEEMQRRAVEVHQRQGRTLIFLLECPTVAEAKAQVEALKDIRGVAQVYLAYYSLEDAGTVASEGAANR